MDALFHFVMSFSGGYILLKGINFDFRIRELFILSILAGMIDLDHFTGLGNEMMLFHNLTFVIGFPVMLFFVFRRLGKDRLAVFSLAGMVMLIGEILMDMVRGMYGVPLFFPFYGELFLIPYVWHFLNVEGSYAIEPAGIAAALYFGIIFSIVLLFGNRKNFKMPFS